MSILRKDKNQTKALVNRRLAQKRVGIYQTPFNQTGIDYVGPLPINQYKKTRSPPNTIKRYGVLFTCLTIQ